MTKIHQILYRYTEETGQIGGLSVPSVLSKYYAKINLALNQTGLYISKKQGLNMVYALHKKSCIYLRYSPIWEVQDLF